MAPAADNDSPATSTSSCFNPNSRVPIRDVNMSGGSAATFAGYASSMCASSVKYWWHSLGKVSNSSVMSGMTVLRPMKTTCATSTLARAEEAEVATPAPPRTRPSEAADDTAAAAITDPRCDPPREDSSSSMSLSELVTCVSMRSIALTSL